MIIVFENIQSFYEFRDDVVATPVIDGSSPTSIQEEPAIAADGIRCAIEHSFSDIELDWLKAYTSDYNPPLIFTESLPEDWNTVSKS